MQYKNKKQCNCIICFNPLFNHLTLNYLFSSSSYICNKCLNKFKVIFNHQLILNIDTLFLYEYNSFIRELIYRYKGCYDIVLKDAFFDQYKRYIKLHYKGYTIVFPPSSKEDDRIRGFVHIKEMVSCLNMNVEDIFYKERAYKQSAHKYKDRKNINSIIKIKKNYKITNKRYLVVDDIYTSGSTLKTIYGLLLRNGVDKQNIKGLIVAKTVNNVEL